MSSESIRNYRGYSLVPIESAGAWNVHIVATAEGAVKLFPFDRVMSASSLDDAMSEAEQAVNEWLKKVTPSQDSVTA